MKRALIALAVFAAFVLVQKFTGQHDLLNAMLYEPKRGQQ